MGHFPEKAGNPKSATRLPGAPSGGGGDGRGAGENLTAKAPERPTGPGGVPAKNPMGRPSALIPPLLRRARAGVPHGRRSKGTLPHNNTPVFLETVVRQGGRLRAPAFRQGKQKITPPVKGGVAACLALDGRCIICPADLPLGAQPEGHLAPPGAIAGGCLPPQRRAHSIMPHACGILREKSWRTSAARMCAYHNAEERKRRELAAADCPP